MENFAFYGTTWGGGAYGVGTVFKIIPGRTLTTLHSFDGTDGSDFPGSGVVQATDGNLYGTTVNNPSGLGTVFKMTPVGALTTLHTFDGTDGQYPYAGLVQATDGNLYGTTFFGGAAPQIAEPPSETCPAAPCSRSPARAP